MILVKGPDYEVLGARRIADYDRRAFELNGHAELTPEVRSADRVAPKKP